MELVDTSDLKSGLFQGSGSSPLEGIYNPGDVSIGRVPALGAGGYRFNSCSPDWRLIANFFQVFKLPYIIYFVFNYNFTIII